MENKTIKLQAINNDDHYSLDEAINGIFESTYDSIVLLSPEGMIRRVNKATLDMTGWTAAELEGQHVRNIVSELQDTSDEPEDIGPTVGLNRLMMAGLLKNIRLNMHKKDGGILPVLLSASTASSEGKTKGIVCISKDLKDIAEMEQKLLFEQEASFSEKVLAITNMAGGLAHEINNPLAIVRGISDLLSEKSKSETLSQEFIIDKTGRIARAVERIRQVVTALMAFSSHNNSSSMKTTPLKTVLDNSLALFNERIQNSRVILNVEEIPDEITVDCQPLELGQVLLHLMSNAFDAVREVAQPKITIGFDILEDSYKLKFEDNGPGISPDILDSITLPFVSGKQIGAGMGLGLSYSKGIIEKIGGELEYNTSGNTTSFIVVLPK